MPHNKTFPELPKEAPGRPRESRYREQFGVIVICAGEAEHKAVYEILRAEGYKCRAVRT